MAVKIRSTLDVHSDGIKCCVYGKAGIGKTTLMATAPNPIILSCESGLLSLAGIDLPYILIEDVQDIYDAFEYLTEGDGKDKYDTIGLDSVSEIAEVLLAALKRTHKDPRAAYGDLADEMGKLIRQFRDIKGKNVIFSAKETRVTDDDTGLTSYKASMPGKTLTNGLPFYFDEVFYMTMEQDEEGKYHRVLKTRTEFSHDAKDRSGELGAIEKPDLSHIFQKIKKGKSAPPKEAVKGEVDHVVEDEDKAEKVEETLFYWYHPESGASGISNDREKLEEYVSNGAEELTKEQFERIP